MKFVAPPRLAISFMDRRQWSTVNPVRALSARRSLSGYSRFAIIFSLYVLSIGPLYWKWFGAKCGLASPVYLAIYRPLENLAEQGISPEKPPYTVSEGGSRLSEGVVASRLNLTAETFSRTRVAGKRIANRDPRPSMLSISSCAP